MISGLAPGNAAPMLIVGKSTCGSGKDRELVIGHGAGQHAICGRPSSVIMRPVGG